MIRTYTTTHEGVYILGTCDDSRPDKNEQTTHEHSPSSTEYICDGSSEEERAYTVSDDVYQENDASGGTSGGVVKEAEILRHHIDSAHQTAVKSRRNRVEKANHDYEIQLITSELMYCTE